MSSVHPWPFLDTRQWVYRFPLYQGISLPSNDCSILTKPNGPPSLPTRQPKFCKVCGDKAKSYHFGGLSCDSCKAFFRRSVQSTGYKNFQCPYKRICEITISSRKCCQFCRFHKCVAIGMEKSWVMTEEERLRILRIRTAKRQHQHDMYPKPGRKHQMDYYPEINNIRKFLTEEDIRCIESIMNSYQVSYMTIAFSSSLCNNAYDRSPIEILDMFFTVVKQFAHFAQQLCSFSVIPRYDQEILLRTGVMELCFLRGAYMFNENHMCWPDHEKMFCKASPKLLAEDLKKLVTTELFEKHMKFIEGVKDLQIDEPTLMILLVTVLLSSDRPGLQNVDLVAREQEKYCVLLKNYMLWRYGASRASVLYPKLFLKLPNLRELTDIHSDYYLSLNKLEVQEIQRRLSCPRIESPTHEESSLNIFPRKVDLRKRKRWSFSHDLLADLDSFSCGSIEDESSSNGSDKSSWTSQKPSSG
ncbi:vitamin D3 receptor-like [Limulus polyphemus]|uniref:Vitamin D3 receptor-like n=1 Tax=Limulus polyphemus TaxID=6850 RepID=A0ABM1B6B5_LIMPO|nr:vitamin D3 receptor-like [Limulus polyphemus]